MSFQRVLANLPSSQLLPRRHQDRCRVSHAHLLLFTARILKFMKCSTSFPILAQRISSKAFHSIASSWPCELIGEALNSSGCVTDTSSALPSASGQSNQLMAGCPCPVCFNRMLSIPRASKLTEPSEMLKRVPSFFMSSLLNNIGWSPGTSAEPKFSTAAAKVNRKLNHKLACGLTTYALERSFLGSKHGLQTESFQLVFKSLPPFSTMHRFVQAVSNTVKMVSESSGSCSPASATRTVHSTTLSGFVGSSVTGISKKAHEPSMSILSSDSLSRLLVGT